MRFAAGVVVGVLTVLLAGFAPASAAAAPALGIEVAPAKSSFAPGEPVELTVRVVNRTGAPCQLAAAPLGAVHLMSLTRDGVAVTPSFARGGFVNGFGAAVRQSLRQVKPQDSVSFRAGLRTDSPLAGGGSLGAKWPVDSVGEYQVAVQYRVPAVSGACAGSSNVATVTFTVGDAASDRTVWLLIAIGAGVLVLLVVVLLLRRRRGAALLVLAMALGAVVVTAPRANAKVSVDPDNQGLSSFGTAYSACMAKIGQFDPALKRDIESGKTPKVKIMPVNQTEDKGSRSVNYPDGRSDIWWNETDRSVLDPRDAVALDPCASLYHELFHAFRNHQGQLSDSICGRSGILRDEVEGTLAENKYRDKMVTVPAGENKFRQFYDGKLLPDSMEACGPPPPKKPAKRGRQCGGEAPSGVRAGLVALEDCGEEKPASSNGDPHLTTFDQRDYAFQAVGEFVAASAGDGYAVHVRQSPVPHSSDRTASVNSAVAMRVGADRVGFYVSGGDVVVRVNGSVVSSGELSLPGGGRVVRGPGSQEYSPDGYTVVWPDGSAADVDGIGQWGLRLLLVPSASLKGKLSGLLGDYDGNAGNDLVTRAGQPVEDSQIHGAFGDSWRLSDEESLFDYASGESTASFTDREFPVRAESELPAVVRRAAEVACKLAGVTDPAVFAQCVLDVAVTGQPAFAVNAADLQALRPASGDGPVDDSGTVKDGQVISGSFESAGEVDSYDVELGAGEEISLVELKGELFSSLVGDPSVITGGTLPGAYQHGVTKAGRYQLQVSTSDGVTGPYGFRVVKLKPRRVPVRLDGSVETRRLDERGRLDMYTFDAGDASSIRVVTDDCENSNLEFDLAEDVPGFELSTPRPWCYDLPLAVEPGKKYVLVVWSSDATEEEYSLGIERG